MRRMLMIAAVGAALAAQPAAAATNLIQNGGFETPGDVGQYRTLYSGDEPAGFGWSITGSVDALSHGGGYTPSEEPAGGGGENALDLVGVGTLGGIYQSFSTQIGKTYRLSFDFSHSPFTSGAAMNFGVSSLAGLAFEQSLTRSGPSDGWQTFTLDFVADAGTSTLFFNNTAGGFWTGMYLDNVAIIDPTEPNPGAVPEPATWALMIGGFGLAGAALRRRRSLAFTAA